MSLNCIKFWCFDPPIKYRQIVGSWWIGGRHGFQLLGMEYGMENRQ